MHFKCSFIATAIGAFLAGATLSPAQAQDLTEVHFGISNRSLLGLPILVAKEKGFFEKHGIDATIDYFAGGVPATAALIGGSVQFVDAAFENNVKAVKKGQPLVSILGLQSHFAGAIVARTDVVGAGPALKVEHLKGLRVGTLARGGFADVSTRYIATNAGLDPNSDLELVPIKGADRQLTAGEAGEIDAAFVMEPWNVIATESGKWRYVVDLTKGEGPQTFDNIGYTTLQTTRDYIAENRGTSEKVAQAVVEALGFAVDPKNLTEVARLADAEYGKPGVEIMKISLERQAHTFTPVLTPDNLAKTYQLLTKSGAIEGPAPAFDEVVDTSFAPLWNAFKPAP